MPQTRTPSHPVALPLFLIAGGLTARLFLAHRTFLNPDEALHYLLANARRVLTRDQILEHVWDYTFAGNASVLETYVSYLRRKVDAADPPLIHTVRGVGYSLRLPPD